MPSTATARGRSRSFVGHDGGLAVPSPAGWGFQMNTAALQACWLQGAQSCWEEALESWGMVHPVLRSCCIYSLGPAHAGNSLTPANLIGART